MAKARFDALDGAVLVRTETIHGIDHIQAWFGGTQVQVFREGESIGYPLTESTLNSPWTLTDENGEPPSRDEIEEHMESHFERIREER